MFAGPYLTHVDTESTAHKPVLVPQKDPAFYDSLVKSFTVPELIIEPVRVSAPSIVKALHSPEKVVARTASGAADGSTQGTTKADPWQPALSGGTQ